MKWMVRLMMIWFVASVFALSGCGGSDDGSTDGLITGVGWSFENTPADLSSYPLGLSIKVYYSETIAVSDIDNFTVTGPDGGRWTLAASTGQYGTTSTGKPYRTARLVNSQTAAQLPLAGVWTVSIRLKNGTSSSYRLKLHEPGSSDDATHPYVYVKEDWTPFTNPSQYIAALGRFPSQGYTVQYSSADGGSITTTGLSSVRSSFFASEPTAYNMFCWLFDANNAYLGYTITEYSTTDRSSSGLVTPGGELLISPASTVGSSGPVDLSLVKSIRFVYGDGAQFAPGAGYDYRSISYLVPVN